MTSANEPDRALLRIEMKQQGVGFRRKAGCQSGNQTMMASFGVGGDEKRSSMERYGREVMGDGRWQM